MTTIKTSSLRTYNRVHNYLYNKHIECWGDLEKLEVSFFGLDKNQTDQRKTHQTFPLDSNFATNPRSLIGCIRLILGGLQIISAQYQ